MKNMIVALQMIVMFLSIVSFGQEPFEKRPTKILFDLKGKVSKVKLYNYNVQDKFGEIIPSDSTGCGSYSFNSDGFLIEQCAFKADGKIQSKTIYKRNPSNVVIEDNFYWEDGNLMNKNLYITDNYGNIVEQNSYNYDQQNVTSGKILFKYDSNGNFIRSDNYYQLGNKEQFHTSAVSRYDVKNNRIERNIYSNLSDYMQQDINWAIRENQGGQTLWEYDNGGRKTKQTEKDLHGKLNSKETYSYDKVGNLLLKSIYDDNSILTKSIVFKYDSLNNVIQKNESNSSGNIEEREFLTTYRYL
jgi:hypothetical protein